MKITTENWKEFKIGDYFHIKRGKRIVKDIDFSIDKDEDFIYPVITPSKSNNSVSGYYHTFNCPANTIVCGGEASGFYSTYQDEKCWIMDRSRMFLPKQKVKEKINKFTAMFLVTIFNKEQFKYSYGRSANPNHILNTTVKLPSTKAGTPDWEYMENFMKEMWGGSLETSIPYIKQELYLEQWKEFKIGDYFHIKRGKRIVKDIDYVHEQDEEYQFPVITASAINNSVSGYYHSFNCQANSIVACGEVSGFYCTYQEEKCWVLDTNRIFIPKKETNLKLNKYIAFFLITIFKKEMFKFSYGRKARPYHIVNTIIKLPGTKDGTPDWEYMEAYIKKLQFSDMI